MNIIGTDFATTNGTIAYLDNSGTMHLPTYPCTMPSGMPMLFMYDSDGKEWAGDQVTAKNGQITDPAAVCQSVKMKLREDQILLNGRSFTPTYIASAIARRQLECGQQALARNLVDIAPDLVVVSVPTTDTAAERGEKLDFHKPVYTQLVDHPIRFAVVDEATAIALTYQYQKTRSTGTVPNHPILVHDSGGGTTDAAVLTPGTGSPFDVHNPKGIREAGDDLDNAALQLVLTKLRANPGSLKLALLEEKTTAVHRRLLAQCRTLKENLSASLSYSMEVSDSCGGYSNVTVTRMEFEDAIRPIIRNMVDLAEEVLNASNLRQRPDLEIILAGGTANVPLLQQMMRERFPWVNPNCFTPRLGPHAVAMGAALYGAWMDHVPSRSTHGYAVRIHTHDTSEKKLLVVIPPNAKMPCSVESSLCTAFADQETCFLHVYEVTKGYTDQVLDLNEGVETDYKLTHRFPHPVPLHTGIKLSTELTKDGILTLVSRDNLPGGFTCEKQFTVSNMKRQEDNSGSTGQSKTSDTHLSDLEKIRRALLNL